MTYYSVLLLAACAVGCTRSDPEDVATDPAPLRSPQTINVLIVDEPAIGPVILRQWRARTDGTINLGHATAKELSDNEFTIDAKIDVLIYPAGLLGELVSRDVILEVPNWVQESTDLNRKELLRYFRTTAVQYAGKTWGTPLGGAQLVMFYRADVLDKLESSPPKTWTEFGNLAQQLGDLGDLTNEEGEPLPVAVDVPLADGWAAQVFLARAAGYTRNRGKLSTVFDLETMKPLIDRAGFIRALTEMKADWSNSNGSELYSPAQVYQRVVGGHAALAIGWPSRALLDEETASLENIEIRSLPGAVDWFDNQSQAWIERDEDESPQVDLLGSTGFLASASKGSSKSRAAFDFIQWLSSKSISVVTMVESSNSGPFRASHLGDPYRWTGQAIPPRAAEAYADAIDRSHSNPLVLVFPRIPGRQAYLDALNTAVLNCLLENADPKTALESAAQQWQEITDRLGREEQRLGLRRSEGLSD